MKRSSMRKPIPAELREQLADDPFMQRCILEGPECLGRIEWNHGLAYAGRRINELYTLVPMCHFHHYHEAKYRVAINGAIRSRIRHFNAEHDFRLKYPRSLLV
jgi:hypothetical protein